MILLVELRHLNGPGFWIVQCLVTGYSGVVDENVNLKVASPGMRKLVLGHIDNVRRASRRVGQVGLQRNAERPVRALQLLAELAGGFGRGIRGVNEQQRAALGSKVLCNCCANPWSLC